MLKRRFAVAIVLLLLLQALSISVNAQEMSSGQEASSDEEMTSEQAISPDKRALIDELMEVSQTKKQVDKVMDIMLLQMENNYGEMVLDVIPESDELDDACRDKIVESATRFVKRFRELYAQRVNMGEIIDEIYYPLYDKYFSSDDLKYMIEFYKSPTGQKFLTIMPDFMKESVQKSSEILNPIMIEMINDIMKEEKGRLKEELKDCGKE